MPRNGIIIWNMFSIRKDWMRGMPELITELKKMMHCLYCDADIEIPEGAEQVQYSGCG